MSTADLAKGGLVEDMAYVLDHGVRVAMIYGDRDFACNWVGGEATSLKIPWEHQEEIRDAGYASLVTDPFHLVGLTRQFGNLSLTRVYQAGHTVPSYQPEVAYKIFMRAVKGLDIPTRSVNLEDYAREHKMQYSNSGPGDTWCMPSKVLPAPPRQCYLLDIGRCSDEEIGWITDGTAVVEDLNVVGRYDPEANTRPRECDDQFTFPGD